MKKPRGGEGGGKEEREEAERERGKGRKRTVFQTHSVSSVMLTSHA